MPHKTAVPRRARERAGGSSSPAFSVQLLSRAALLPHQPYRGIRRRRWLRHVRDSIRQLLDD